MKRICIAIIGASCLLFSSANAQQTMTGKVIPLSSQSKENLQRHLSQLSSFSAHFSQTVVDAQGELLQEAQGELKLKQPSRMMWHVTAPDESVLIADGTTLWHSDPFVEQVTASDQAKSVANNPIILLTSNDPSIWQQFDVVQDGDDFAIHSLDPQTQVEKLTLTFSDDTLVSLQMIDRQQQVNTLVFSSIQQNGAMSDDIFIFTIPDGFELDDQRPK